MKNTNILLKASILLATLILSGGLAQESRAATFVVNSTLDVQDASPGKSLKKNQKS